MKVFFIYVVKIIPISTLKRTHDHEENWNRRPAFLQTTKKGCTTREERTRSRRHVGCQMPVLTKHSQFLPRKLLLTKLMAQHDKWKLKDRIHNTSIRQRTSDRYNLTRKQYETEMVWTHRPNGRQTIRNTACQRKGCKTRMSLSKWHRGATGSGVNKDINEHRKLDDTAYDITE